MRRLIWSGGDAAHGPVAMSRGQLRGSAAGFPDSAAGRRSARTIETALQEAPNNQRELRVPKIWGDPTFDQIAAQIDLASHAAASRSLCARPRCAQNCLSPSAMEDELAQREAERMRPWACPMGLGGARPVAAARAPAFFVATRRPPTPANDNALAARPPVSATAPGPVFKPVAAENVL